jgi:hypothetical protein
MIFKCDLLRFCTKALSEALGPRWVIQSWIVNLYLTPIALYFRVLLSTVQLCYMKLTWPKRGWFNVPRGTE